jgi:nucleotide-binding universal stress UspA family protein
MEPPEDRRQRRIPRRRAGVNPTQRARGPRSAVELRAQCGPSDRLGRDTNAWRASFAAEARASVDAPTWEGIVDLANHIDAAVIVLGSRGLNGARELLEGSISHRVAEHAGRPVLIVPPTDTRR